MRGRGDGEVAALVLVEDASKDGGGVEIGNTVGLDWRDRRVRTKLEDRTGRTRTGTVQANLGVKD